MTHFFTLRAIRLCAFVFPLVGPLLIASLTRADDPQPVSAAPLSQLHWHPEGKIVTYLRRIPGENRSHDALWSYDVDAASEKLLLDPEAKPPGGDAKPVAWRLSGYRWAPDGKGLLVTGGNDLWLVPTNGDEPRRLTQDEREEQHASLSPDGTRVAFVKDNDLHVVDVKTGAATRITREGSETILNGKLDWVYDEEFGHLAGRQHSYAWSPDGRSIAFLRLDQSGVPEHPLVEVLETPPRVSKQRYPNAGDPNSTPAVFVVAADGTTSPARMPLPPDAEYVLPEFAWSPDSSAVHVMTLNRGQSDLTVHAWNPQSAEPPRVLLREHDEAWLNVHDVPRFLGDRSGFVWLSERDGWLQAWLCDGVGSVRRQLTQGNWQIDPSGPHDEGRHPFAVDPAGAWGYFVAAAPDPRERHIHRVRLEDSKLERLTQEPGTHAMQLSPDGRHLIDVYSSVDHPAVTRLLRADGTAVATLHRTEPPKSESPQPTHEFHEVTAADGTKLYARLTKPADFDPAKKYPVVVNVYGGPQLQLVRNVWGGGSSAGVRARLAKEGFLIWSLDNRGSTGRGHAWETAVFRNLGEKELADQLDGLAYLKTLPFVDEKRFGLFGWSYGGYMTLYALTHAPDAFACGVAGAPVADWKYYDTIYTERYMRTPQENPDGYRKASPIAAAGQLKSKLLVIHGTSDDNVHMQNSMLFVDAVIQAGKQCELQLQPGQRHGFSGARANQFLNDRIVEFFKRNL